MQNIVEKLLAQSRAYGTNEERVVLALESIADQIRSLVSLLAPMNTFEEGAESAASIGLKAADEATWENEGGSLGEGAAVSLGIKHTVTDEYETGGYRYTQLAHAIAEAKRARARSPL